MIKVESSGRMGNKLHHFVFAKYVSQITNQTLIPERIEGFKHTYYNHEGSNDKDYNYIKTSQLDINNLNIYEIIKNHDGGIIVDNMLAKYYNFSPLSEYINEYLEIENEDSYVKPSMNDLVIHVRLGDYKNIGWVTDKTLFLKVVNEEEYDKCYIVTDAPNDEYLKEFRDLGCVILSKSELEDFIFIKNANKICISKSTFSWLSAYLSNASKIYFPLSDNKAPYVYNPNSNQADLRPLDKKNWIII